MIGRVVYAAIFCLAIPVLLTWWALRLDEVTELPAVRVPEVGLAVAFAGLALTIWAMWSLWHIGGGLPMNAFPPRRRVESGPFALFTHPIYVGFVLICGGTSLWYGSAAGLWIVTPIAALGSAALVLGYERDAIARLFGPPTRRPLFSLPPSDSAPITWREVNSVWGMVLLPWLIAYEAVGHLPVPGAIDILLPRERAWPVLPWTELIYASVYPVVILTPFVACTRARLRRFAEAGLVATVIATLFYLTVPASSPPRPVLGDGPLADLLRWERADGLNGRAAYPAFHMTWALIAAAVLSGSLAQRAARFRRIPWLWAAALGASCITTGMHAVADIAAGVLLWILAWWWRPIASVLSRWAEVLANSWHEWRLGHVRIISHALFAGLSAAIGACIITGLAGPTHLSAVVLIAVAALAGAGLWGQVFVKRPTSSRPFGYFGCILGSAAGMLLAWSMGLCDWVILAAFAIAAPWIQAIGRLRCLVQGCCHGRPTASFLAIRYTHPRTRVCRVSGLADQPLHPTPLYSILVNIAIGLLLARLWEVRAPAAFITGAYLILAGLLRFVEEHLRGEPHTPAIGGLRIYQWFAAASVLFGIALSVVPSPATAIAWTWSTQSVLASMLLGLLFAVAMGVDFPDSSRRFARLA